MNDNIRIHPKDSLISALINAVINGAIAWFAFKDKSLVPMSLDIISTTETSVWGQAVSLTFGLGIILSIITAKVFSSHQIKAHPELASRLQRPVFPDLLKIAISNTVALFGWFVALAVLWTRIFGVIQLPNWVAACCVGLFAAVITVIVEIWTKKALLSAQ